MRTGSREKLTCRSLLGTTPWMARISSTAEMKAAPMTTAIVMPSDVRPGEVSSGARDRCTGPGDAGRPNAPGASGRYVSNPGGPAPGAGAASGAGAAEYAPPPGGTAPGAGVVGAGGGGTGPGTAGAGACGEPGDPGDCGAPGFSGVSEGEPPGCDSPDAWGASGSGGGVASLMVRPSWDKKCGCIVIRRPSSDQPPPCCASAPVRIVRAGRTGRSAAPAHRFRTPRRSG